MFPVELQVLVSAKAQRDPIGLSRTIELSFAPFPGLLLFGLTEDPEEGVIIDNVAYNVIDRTFSCELVDDQYSPEDEDDDRTVLTMGQKIAGYGDEWDVIEPGVDAEDED